MGLTSPMILSTSSINRNGNVSHRTKPDGPSHTYYSLANMKSKSTWRWMVLPAPWIASWSWCTTEISHASSDLLDLKRNLPMDETLTQRWWKTIYFLPPSSPLCRQYKGPLKAGSSCVASRCFIDQNCMVKCRVF